MIEGMERIEINVPIFQNPVNTELPLLLINNPIAFFFIRNIICVKENMLREEVEVFVGTAAAKS